MLERRYGLRDLFRFVESDAALSDVKDIKNTSISIGHCLRLMDLAYEQGKEYGRSESLDHSLIKISITQLPLTAGTKDCLRAAGIETLWDLVRVTKKELLRAPNIGKRRLEEIRLQLIEKGLDLRQE